MSVKAAVSKKPAKLDPDCCWVSVSRVIDSNGARNVEMAWCCEYIRRRGEDRSSIADECALVWYDETDQSEEAEVELRIEDHNGVVSLAVCKLWPRIECKVKSVRQQ
ncbi:MAG: hypothetical protein ACK4WH_13070 [Phycisphaerales bacterium]